ncbi:hypothetical protein TNCT_473571, partial [Trichonephila clavata]
MGKKSLPEPGPVSVVQRGSNPKTERSREEEEEKDRLRNRSEPENMLLLC